MALKVGDKVTADLLVGEWMVRQLYVSLGRERVEVLHIGGECRAHVWLDDVVKVLPTEPPTGSAVLVNDVVWVHGTSYGWHTHGADGADCLTKKWAEIADKATVLHAATIT